MADPTYEWRFDPRLNIDRLILHVDPDRLTQEEKTELALRYQEMAAQIPAQVKAFERRYMACYEELKQAEDDESFYSLIDEMNDLSSRISDLNILYLEIEGRYLAGKVHG
ncbi:MAG: hypothetical protein LOD87_02850 [Planifilum fulgidum]